MSATKILWGQILTVFLIVLATTWGATEWVAWRLAFQPELGAPWFTLFGFPFYLPPSFFWWWYGFDAYAPAIFVEGAFIAASGGFISIAVAIGMLVGVPLGIVAGMNRGGIIEQLIVRGADIVLAFPALLMAIIAGAMVGASTGSAMVAIGIASIPAFIRVSRAGTLRVVTAPF
ncbi:MAG: hypothetical protein E6417_29540, partial [Bradyrhizobium sp.]|nr:hypothetical protein [Bradyrhizobium sp.]